MIPYGTLQIQTCRLVQIFESVYPGIPAPPELQGWATTSSIIERVRKYSAVSALPCTWNVSLLRVSYKWYDLISGKWYDLISGQWYDLISGMIQLGV